MTGTSAPEDMQRAEVPLTALIAEQGAMSEVLASGRVSDTPDERVWLKASPDHPGCWEIADGHHRVAAALKTGQTTIAADLDPISDDEPYNEPFYDFGADDIDGHLGRHLWTP